MLSLFVPGRSSEIIHHLALFRLLLKRSLLIFLSLIITWYATKNTIFMENKFLHRTLYRIFIGPRRNYAIFNSYMFQVKMRDSLVSLLQTVRLIYSVSRYYNTSERTSSLMIKITNQMIVACRDYVTNRGRETVWGQDRTVARSKLKHCLRLNK